MNRDTLEKAAQTLSHILSPPASLAAVGFAIAFAPDIGVPLLPALGWALLHGVIASLIPTFYIFYLLKTGGISDLHMQRREDRNKPFVVGVLSPLAVLVVVLAFDGPQLFLRMAVFDILLFLTMGLINLWWQISTHSASIMSVIVIIGVVFGWQAGLIVSPLVLIVTASRLILKRHSVSQIVAGLLLGLTVVALAFVIL